MKTFIARQILKWQLPKFLADPHPFNRLMGEAIRLQTGKLPEDQYRLELERFFASREPAEISRDLDLEAKSTKLNRPGGYKVNVLGLKEDQFETQKPGLFDFWRRRFSLLNRLHVRPDVIILREGEQVYPHGHSRVVSGFYVLEGSVSVRHYDRIREEGDKLILKKVIDETLEPGGYSTDSEYFQNIHWFIGRAPVSYLFRVTVTDTPVAPFGGPDRNNVRDYVDPTAEPNEDGLITARYVSEKEVKSIEFDYDNVRAIS